MAVYRATNPVGPYSHQGEDEWVLRQFPEGYLGCAVELGALDGRYLSNTLMLEERGWRCLCIEPNPRFHGHLIQNRRLVLCCACGSEPVLGARLVEDPRVFQFTRSQIAWSEPGETLVLTLDQCLALAGFSSLDVLSLDVDGAEVEILSGFSVDRWRPRALVLETDAAEDGVHDWATRSGYLLDSRIGHNGCYLRKE